ncbi:MAG: DUF386 domain-containing protein [Ruminococcaceae bacterium]|nr:DUF386 domain-containing protein [Oscillospiraceae bacterium]
MIIDKLSNLRSYASFNEKFNIICEFLEKNDLNSLCEGRIDLSDGVFLNISSYEPYSAGDKWETHKKYADLQIVVEGDECMDASSITDVEGPNGYNEDDDYEFYDICKGSVTTVRALPGTFAYFAPCDPHRPGIKFNSEKVKKAVFKIPV